VKASRLLAFLVLTAFTARAADLVPEPGTKFVPVTTIVEVEEEFTDYVLVSLSWEVDWIAPPPVSAPKSGVKRSGPGVTSIGQKSKKSESTFALVTIAPGKPLQHTGSTRTGRALYAVPKSALDESGDLTKLAVAVQNDSVPDAKLHPLRSFMTLYADDPHKEIIQRWRLQRAPGGGVEFMRTDQDPALYEGRVEGGDEPPRTKRSPLAVAGAAATVGVILAGLWVMSRTRRLSRTTRAASRGS
jgi:hypothetical protein